MPEEALGIHPVDEAFHQRGPRVLVFQSFVKLTQQMVLQGLEGAEPVLPGEPVLVGQVACAGKILIPAVLGPQFGLLHLGHTLFGEPLQIAFRVHLAGRILQGSQIDSVHPFGEFRSISHLFGGALRHI